MSIPRVARKQTAEAESQLAAAKEGTVSAAVELAKRGEVVFSLSLLLLLGMGHKNIYDLINF